LKPENILCVSPGSIDHVKVADFGLAKDFERDMMSTTLGTPHYSAPEVILGLVYGPNCDVWSVGVITYIMLGGVMPFYDEDAMKLVEQIISGKYTFTRQFDGVSRQARDFISLLLELDPTVRPDAGAALAHPWLRNSTKAPLASVKTLRNFAPAQLNLEKKWEEPAKKESLRKTFSKKRTTRKPRSDPLTSVQDAYLMVRNRTQNEIRWVVFKVDEANTPKFASSGGKLDDILSLLADDVRMFVYLRVEHETQHKYLFASWCGPHVPPLRRAKMTVARASCKEVVKEFSVEVSCFEKKEFSAALERIHFR
jgi:serine/threonine protein kinase